MSRQILRRRVLAGAAATFAIGRARLAHAAASSPGISAGEIKLGTTAYYSGPASTAAAYGQAQVAYFQMVNDRGGINGRKVNLISLDNAFSPPKALEQTRRLVESDGVFAIAGSLGTPTNVAIQKYLNAKGVPNLFLTSGAERFTARGRCDATLRCGVTTTRAWPCSGSVSVPPENLHHRRELEMEGEHTIEEWCRTRTLTSRLGVQDKSTVAWRRLSHCLYIQEMSLSAHLSSPRSAQAPLEASVLCRLCARGPMIHQLRGAVPILRARKFSGARNFGFG
jgi:hypothetical protein